MRMTSIRARQQIQYDQVMHVQRSSDHGSAEWQMLCCLSAEFYKSLYKPWGMLLTLLQPTIS
jgi:hypothetical protein